MHRHETNRKGSVAELAIATAAAKLGVHVLTPLTEHARYDLAFAFENSIVRVQCKWPRVQDDVAFINLCTYRYTHKGPVRGTYAPGEIDAVAAYAGAVDRCFLLPIELIANRKAIQLRLGPTRNGQRACLNWADAYELQGAVAQLEERRSGTPKATGSSPVSSIPAGVNETVGAHEFRNLFGWYMERAAAGDHFVITRRGRPHVRLGPPAG